MSIATLADIEAFEAVPAETRWRGQNVYDLIAKSASRFAGRPAIKYQETADLDEPPQVITYGELLGAIHQTANALHAAGVSVGGVTAVIMPTLPETAYAMWGAQTLGIVAPINPLLEAHALRDIMLEAEVEALVVEGPAAGSDIWEKTARILRELPDLKVVLQVNRSATQGGAASPAPAGVPVRDLNRAMAGQRSDGLDFDRTILPSDIAAYFHTGGTTGRPKLARHSHANQVHTASFMADFFGYDENTVALGGLPLFHVNSFFNAALNPLACGGHSIYVTSAGFRNRQVIANLWDLLDKYSVTYFATVPTVVSSLLEVPIGSADLSTMDFIICGAAPISPQVFSQFQDKVGITVLEAYGMTEGSLFSAGNPQHGEKRVGSIGIRVPYQPMKCVIIDDDGHYVRDCALDEPGVIVFRGPNVFMGYKQEDKNKDAFIDGEWLVSGDLARQDADGYFWMTGRAKDLIIRGGHNIDPKGIEDTLAAHPAVALAAAIGQPDAYAGEKPCAYVTLNEEVAGPSPTSDELMAFARDNVPERAAAPAAVEILQTMPTTAVGKIFKPDLRAMAARRVLGEAVHDIAPGATIRVERSERHGLLARVSGVTDDLREAVSAALGKFTVAYAFDASSAVAKGDQ
ncbi:MAG: acyl-CoA synthetase [Pseudomonadota bacterium]